MSRYRSSLLTIGTEVSSGQIVNTNASWLADQLINLHYEPMCHLTVPDVERDILDALNFLASRSDYIFVTGGLGPTSDDITRHVISLWTQDQLHFDQAAWEHIERRFQTIGTPPPESNRQQCLFPSKAQIIFNPKGTAHAFAIKTAELFLCCLPGPPDEIKAIWQDSLQKSLSSMVKDTDPFQLFRWQCLGLSESALGELVEKIIQGSPLVSGYRPHVPYVEIKIWCRKSQLDDQKPVFNSINEALKPWTVSRNDEDILDAFLAVLSEYSKVNITDSGSMGAIGERIGKSISGMEAETCHILYQSLLGTDLPPQTEPEEGTLYLTIGPVQSDGSWTLSWRTTEIHRQKTLKLPFRRDSSRRERERRFVSEMSLAAWARCPQGDLWA